MQTTAEFHVPWGSYEAAVYKIYGRLSQNNARNTVDSVQKMLCFKGIYADNFIMPEQSFVMTSLPTHVVFAQLPHQCARQKNNFSRYYINIKVLLDT